MPRCFTIIIFLSLTFNCFPQSKHESKNSIKSGYGYYNGFHVEVARRLKNPTKRLQFGAGIDRFYKSASFYYMFTCGIESQLWRWLSSKDKMEKWKVGYHVMYWQWIDEHYKFSVLGLNPVVGRDFHLSGEWFIEARVGPIVNILLKSTRRGNEIIGRPRKLMPNFSISLRY